MPSCEGALVFSLTTGEEVARVGEKFASYPISAISPDGNAILWTHDGGPANDYAVDGTLLFSGTAPQSFFSVNFDPTSRYLLVGCREFHRGSREERSIQVYSLNGDRAFPAVEAAAIGAQSIVLNIDASVLAVGQGDGVVRLIDFPSGRARGEGHVLDASITALAYADDGRLVAGDEHGRYVGDRSTLSIRTSRSRCASAFARPHRLLGEAWQMTAPRAFALLLFAVRTLPPLRHS